MAENLVEHIEQSDWDQESWDQESGDQGNGRFKQPIMVAAAGIGAALIIMTLPHVYLENIVGATGLSEIVPAASPPLGTTARSLIAIMASLVSASAVYYFLNRKGDSEMGVALRENINAAHPVEQDRRETGMARKFRFSLPKFDARSLTRFLKKPKNDKARVMDLADLPQLRRISSGIDSGVGNDETGNDIGTRARTPIFAESEDMPAAPLTGGDQPFEEVTSDEAMPDTLSDPAMEMPVDEILIEEALAGEALADEALADTLATDEASISETPADHLTDLTIAQLADRLEAGLNRLKQLEAGSAATTKTLVQPTVSQPIAAPVSEAVIMPSPPIHQVAEPQEAGIEDRMEDGATTRHADMDAALKAALGTLEKMTSQR